MLLIISANFGNSLHSVNTISNAASCGDDLLENSKLNDITIFAQSRQVRWIFFLNLELEQALFCKKFVFLKYHRFHLSKLYYCNEKLCLYSFCSFSNGFYLEKNLLFSSFYQPCQRNKRALLGNV